MKALRPKQKIYQWMNTAQTLIAPNFVVKHEQMINGEQTNEQEIKGSKNQQRNKLNVWMDELDQWICESTNHSIAERILICWMN